MKKLFIMLSVSSLILLFPIKAHAIPVFWDVDLGGNGHYYDQIDAVGNWFVAKSGAEFMTNLGKSGYLATITSEEERVFILDSFPSGRGWLGATDMENEGVWLWGTGPETGIQFWQGGGGGTTTAPFNYAAWAIGQPDNSRDEDCGYSIGVAGTWGDVPCTEGTIHSYFVEFDAPEGQSNAVPEPATMLLFGSGMIGTTLAA